MCIIHDVTHKPYHMYDIMVNSFQNISRNNDFLSLPGRQS